MLYRPIELTIMGLLPDKLDFLDNYFPLQVLSRLIEIPFPRYWFQEIQDYVAWDAVAVVIVYTALFVYAVYAKLKSSDL